MTGTSSWRWHVLGLWVTVVVLLGLHLWGRPVEAVGPERSVAWGGVEPASFDALLARVRALDRRLEQRVGAPQRTTEAGENLGLRLFRLEAAVAAIAKQAEAHTAPAVPQVALSDGDVAALSRALDAGLDPNARDSSGRPLIVAAAVRGHSGLVDLLHRRGASLEARSEDRDMTALLAALDADQETIAMQLLDRGARVDVVDDNGEDALMWAAFGNADKVVARIVAAGGDVRHQSHAGATALTDAARKGWLGVVRRLVQAGADIHHRTKKGESALSLAERGGHAAVAELLRQHGAR